MLSVHDGQGFTKQMPCDDVMPGSVQCCLRELAADGDVLFALTYVVAATPMWLVSIQNVARPSEEMRFQFCLFLLSSL